MDPLTASDPNLSAVAATAGSAVGISLLRTALDTSSATLRALVDTLPSAPPSRSLNPAVGTHLDVKA